MWTSAPWCSLGGLTYCQTRPLDQMTSKFMNIYIPFSRVHDYRLDRPSAICSWSVRQDVRIQTDFLCGQYGLDVSIELALTK